MSTPLLLVGAGGLAREALATLEQRTDLEVVGFLDDEPGLHGTAVNGVAVLGGLAAVSRFPAAELVICAGKGSARSMIANRLRQLGVGTARFATIIDSSVRVPTTCRVGVGCIV